VISAWEEYSKAGPASDSDVEEAEALLGVKFPDDFVALMKSHQGMIPVPRFLRLFDPRRKTSFPPLMHVSRQHGGADYIPASARRRRAGGYPSELIPFASAGGQTHFALDYRDDPERPSVVYAVLEFGYDDPKTFRRVAENVTDLLSRLEDE